MSEKEDLADGWATARERWAHNRAGLSLSGRELAKGEQTPAFSLLRRCLGVLLDPALKGGPGVCADLAISLLPAFHDE